MKTALLLSALAAAPAHAVPGGIDLDRLSAGLGVEGFAVPEGGRLSVAAPPTPVAVPVAGSVTPPDDASVALTGLLDRHLTTADGFDDAAGRTFLAVTLDFTGDGWLAVTPPGRATMYVKIERGMSATWSARGRSYSLDLNVNIFRPKLNNIFEIKSSGATIWRRRIIDILQKTFEAARPVVIGGRAYRLFLARMPDRASRPAVASDKRGVCLIYDQLDGAGRHDQYDPYGFPLESLERGAPLAVQLYGGDRAFLHVSSDGSELTISR
jgi:hypothetical protein